MTGRPATREIERLKTLQTALGDCHDLAVLSSRIARVKEGLARGRPVQPGLAAGLERLAGLGAARLDARLQAFRRGLG